MKDKFTKFFKGNDFGAARIVQGTDIEKTIQAAKNQQLYAIAVDGGQMLYLPGGEPVSSGTAESLMKAFKVKCTNCSELFPDEGKMRKHFQERHAEYEDTYSLPDLPARINLVEKQAPSSQGSEIEALTRAVSQVLGMMGGIDTRLNQLETRGEVATVNNVADSGTSGGLEPTIEHPETDSSTLRAPPPLLARPGYVPPILKTSYVNFDWSRYGADWVIALQTVRTPPPHPVLYTRETDPGYSKLKLCTRMSEEESPVAHHRMSELRVQMVMKGVSPDLFVSIVVFKLLSPRVSRQCQEEMRKGNLKNEEEEEEKKRRRTAIQH